MIVWWMKTDAARSTISQEISRSRVNMLLGRVGEAVELGNSEILSRYRLKGHRLRAKEEALSRFRDNKSRVKWTSVLSRLRLGLSRLRLSIKRPRLNKTWEETARVTEQELEAALSRDRPKGACVGKVRVNEEGMSRDRANRLRPKMSRQGDKQYIFESCTVVC